MSKNSHFVEGFVLGAIVCAAAAWFYCFGCDKKKCSTHEDAPEVANRTRDLISQTRDAIDKGFDKLAKMAETRQSTDTEK